MPKISIIKNHILKMYLRWCSTKEVKAMIISF
jgi:hypothetical protein